MEARVWFGVIAAPAAWTIQHVFGYGVTEAACNDAAARWGVPVDTLAAIVTAVAAAVALAGLISSVLVFRSTEDHAPPPEGRRHFLGVVGMTISPLFLCIILMSGIGTIVLSNCQQS